MSVDKDTVRRVARLARIAFSEERLEPMAGVLNRILAWVEMRDGVVTDGGVAEAVTQNAPLGEDHYFAVPKVVE